MNELVLGLVSAFWLGILTSISPCPMATNVAAVSYVSRRLSSPRLVFLTGIFYTIGRTLTYVVLGAVLVSSLLSAVSVSHYLQKYLNKALGPILILAGLVLLDLVKVNLSGPAVSERIGRKLEPLGLFGAALLGALFALSFCPVSAALFFGSLLPTALKLRSGFLLPAAYGIATGLPVLVFSVAIAFGTLAVGKVFDRLTSFERKARKITGIVFLIVGIYYCRDYLM